MRKLQFGCGGNKLAGWENFDAEVDIRKPLPFPDGCAQFIFAEHVIEHVTHQEAWSFLEECKRVLCKKGVVRIAIPDITQLRRRITQAYQKAVKDGGYGDGSGNDALKALVFCHGHQAAWNIDLLWTFMEAVGFVSIWSFDCGQSLHDELTGIEGHGKVVGQEIAFVETACVEGTKP